MAYFARVFGSCALVAMSASVAFGQSVVISQIYGGGGNSGATLTHDYVELLNTSDDPVDVTGWSVQYASAAGSSWQVTPLSGVIQPGHYYLVREAQGAGGTTPLPTPDALGSIPMSGTSGKVALVVNTTALTCGSSPCLPNANIADFVGYGGSATQFEGGGPTPTLSNTTAALRANSGCLDTNSNATDFGTGTPAPRNSASPASTCAGNPGPTCTVDTSIAAVQGSGQSSPLVGATVSLEGIVTGRVTTGSARGYFIQMPAPGDGDASTSDGLFVFTGSATPDAAAVVGNLVCVRANVAEFVPASDPGTLPLTELTAQAALVVRSTGHALPAPVVLTAAHTPTNVVGALERFEGMRVQVNTLTVVGPTMGSINSNALATSNGVFYGVIAGVSRPHREPGYDAAQDDVAGVPAGAPIWDGNPERIRVDSDAIGAQALDVTSNATVTNLVGPLSWAFRTYSLFLDPAVPASVSGLITGTPVPARATDEWTLAALQLHNFYDTVNDPDKDDTVFTAAGVARKMTKMSRYIRNILRSPDIIAVQEAENLVILDALADKLNADDPTLAYEARLSEGNDPGGIDVGFLVNTARVAIVDVTQEGLTTTWTDPNGNVDRLNDRPPLVLRATVSGPGGPLAVTVVNVHQRSLIGLTDPADGARVRAKRRQQAEFLANLIQARQTATPSERIIVAGDFNAFPFNDGYVDVTGTVLGTPASAAQVLLASPDLVTPNFANAVGSLAPLQRYSFVFDGNAQNLDQILVNGLAQGLFSRGAVSRANADFPETLRNDDTRAERASDHDSTVAYFLVTP